MCAWRNTPRADGYSPAQILFGRRQGTGLPTLPGHHNAIDRELAVGRRDATAVRGKLYSDRGSRPLGALFVGDRGCWMNDQLHHQPTDFTQSREKILHLAVGLQDEQDFQDHLDQILIPRAVGSNNHTLVETYIQDTLTTLGWTVTLDRFTQETLVGPRTFTNIIADFDPSTAHYDSMVRIDGFVGATDSAVPTAMMLNLAHTMDIMFSDLLSSNPDLTPTLVFFDGEEAMDHWTSDDSLYGSTHLAELWFNQTFSDPNSDCTEPTTFMDRIDLLFLMDLLGTPKPNFQSFQFGDDGPDPYYPMLDQIEEAVDFFHPTSTSFMFNGVESISHVLWEDTECTPDECVKC
eukprot:maker-scaffold77_size404793-snap-gene-2.13 protein:Tk04779 transcript:maker-scaffold77_size404793-snap-gene-2.13-mRNA-1 annotation:"achain crystal structure of a glutaminyl cyclase from ixodes scapularis"